VIQAALIAALATGVASAQQILINAAGATFPYPMYSKWFDEYHKKFPKLAFNYQYIGSDDGIKQVTEGTVDFGASDGPMNDMQLKEFHDKHGYGILHFPTVMGADVPVYNVAGVSTDLVFTADALAGIFLGKITKWNDPELMKANLGVKLPSADIVVVHRSDGSGTTYIWTDYLSKVSKEWETKAGRGTSVNWPVGLGGKGNEGVSGQVQQMTNYIGYVGLINQVKNKMKSGNVKIKPELFGGQWPLPPVPRISAFPSPTHPARTRSPFQLAPIPERSQIREEKAIGIWWMRMADHDQTSCLRTSS
jgi:phosphate transport system substrate-binding protein